MVSKGTASKYTDVQCTPLHKENVFIYYLTCGDCPLDNPLFATAPLQYTRNIITRDIYEIMA